MSDESTWEAPRPEEPTVASPALVPPGQVASTPPATPGAWPTPATRLDEGAPRWAPGHAPAAHKPGAVPLRPLALGDMWGASIKIIRVNPGGTVGASVLVGSLAMLLPVLVGVVLTWGTGMVINLDAADPDGNELLGILGVYGTILMGTILQALGMVLVTGMIAHVVHAATLGRRLSLSQAWAATLGQRWRLIGLVALVTAAYAVPIAGYVGLWVLALQTLHPTVAMVLGLATLPFFLAAMCWLWVRLLLLPVPVLMLERAGVLDSLRRSYRLSAQQFWRLLGIALLTALVVQTAASVISTPIAVAGAVASVFSVKYAALGLILSNAISTVVVATLTYPFTSAVTTLQYLDQRIRKEGYDLDLIEATGGGAPR